MFDPEGIWHEDVYHTPQNGPAAGLGILNAFQSQNNYQQSHADQLLKLMQMLGGNQNSPALAASDEGQQLIQQAGIDPTKFQQFVGGTPIGQMAQYRQANPDASLEDIATQEARTGLQPAASTASLVRGQNAEEGKNYRFDTSQLNKLSMAGKKNFVELARTYAPDQAFQMAMATDQADIPANPALAPTAQATVDLKKAQAGKTKAQTAEIAPDAQAKRDLQAAQKSSADALAAFRVAQASLLGSKDETAKAGVLTRLDTAISAADTDAGKLLVSASKMDDTNPQKATTLLAASRLQAQAKQMRDRRAAMQPAPTVKSAPGTKTTPAKMFVDESDYRAKYTQKHGAPPTDENVALAKTQGLF